MPLFMNENDVTRLNLREGEIVNLKTDIGDDAERRVHGDPGGNCPPATPPGNKQPQLAMLKLKSTLSIMRCHCGRSIRRLRRRGPSETLCSDTEVNWYRYIPADTVRHPDGDHSKSCLGTR
jgi:hypothetical protein